MLIGAFGISQRPVSDLSVMCQCRPLPEHSHAFFFYERKASEVTLLLEYPLITFLSTESVICLTFEANQGGGGKLHFANFLTFSRYSGAQYYGCA